MMIILWEKGIILMCQEITDRKLYISYIQHTVMLQK